MKAVSVSLTIGEICALGLGLGLPVYDSVFSGVSSDDVECIMYNSKRTDCK